MRITFVALVVIVVLVAVARGAEESLTESVAHPEETLPPSDEVLLSVEPEEERPAEVVQSEIYTDADKEKDSLEVDGDLDTPTSPKAKDETESSSNEETATHKQRLWGSPASSGHAPVNNNNNINNNDSQNTEDSTTSSSSAQSDSTENATRIPHPHIPFVAGNKHNNNNNNDVQHPPDGFAVSARVYIDPTDRLAHFDDGPAIALPYWDCGATGATTSPIPLKNGYFRHALASTATSWTGTDGKHPVLTVALSPVVVELNSGETQTFQAGQVFLLEDVLLSGHRLKPLNGRDLKVLFLTLPQQHYHTGKQHVSLQVVNSNNNNNNNNKKGQQDPCPDQPTTTKADGNNYSFQAAPDSSGMTTLGGQQRRIRLTILGALGMSLSTLAADFLGKTAPLWLAVGVGGTCFVAGGTYAVTTAGDKLLTALELWTEQRRLRGRVETTTTTTTTTTSTQQE